MTERRLFAPALPEPGELLLLPRDSAHHARVLRLAAGARVVVFDGRLGEADAELVELGKDSARARVLARRTLPAPSPALQLVLGVPKGAKLEDIARMLGELGVASLHLAHSARSVPRLERPAQRIERLQRIAIEACAQSGQPAALAVHAPRPLLEVATQAPEGAGRVLFYEDAATPLGDYACARDAELWAVVGPEGGFAPDEVDALRALGYAAIGLGRARLRVQTAAPVIAGLLLERLGRLR